MGHICNLKGYVWQSCFSISTWQVCRGQHVWLPGGADKMSGLYAQISWAVSHFRPLYKYFWVSGPFLSIQAFFKLNKVTDHHKENIHSIVWGKKGWKMEPFTLLCLDYKQIFTPVLGLRLMKNSANYLKQTHLHTFHNSQSLWRRLPRLKIKRWRRKRANKVFRGWLTTGGKLLTWLKFITDPWCIHFSIHQPCWRWNTFKGDFKELLALIDWCNT